MGVGPIAGQKKRRVGISACISPRARFLTPHSSFTCTYQEDMWTEISNYLDARSLVRLGMANRWFHRVVMEDSVWKYACLRDLQVPAPQIPISCTWKQLYTSSFDGSHSYTFRNQEKHIDWLRIGAFCFDSPTAVLTEHLSPPRRLLSLDENPARRIQSYGYCVVGNIKTGIWIADLQLVRCPVCNLNTCEGTMQTLDARHSELFLQEEFKAGAWDYEEIGVHKVDKHSKAAAGAIFDVKHVNSPGTAAVVNIRSWIGKETDWQPKTRIGLHAVAVNTNLQQNEGLNVKFQVMKAGRDGEVVSIRISQQLL